MTVQIFADEGYWFMGADPGSRTSLTLLGRLRDAPDDAAAWEAFVRRYGPKIDEWCRYWRLQEADAEDVTQNVLLCLAQKLRSFQYDAGRSFRGWLRTLTQHALSDFLEARGHRGRPGRGHAALHGAHVRRPCIRENDAGGLLPSKIRSRHRHVG